MLPINFRVVEEGKLYRGGEPTDDQIRELKDKFGINKIVTLDAQTGAAIEGTCRALGIEPVVVPLSAIGTDNKNVGTLTDNIQSLLGEGGPVYVNCRNGEDRTGLAVALYRVANGWPVLKAEKEAWDLGMGRGLPSDTVEWYYGTVEEFAERLNPGSVNHHSREIEEWDLPTGFDVVEPNVLYRGSAPTKFNVWALKQLGINKIVSLDVWAGQDIKEQCEELGIKQYILPISAKRKHPTPNERKVWKRTKKNLAAIKHNILALLGTDGPTYVHCMEGLDRTSLVVGFYELAKGMDLDEVAQDAMKHGMGRHSPHKEWYWNTLYDYAESLKEAGDNSAADDIAEMVREEFNGPAINNYNINERPSFAPYSDPDEETTLRAANEGMARTALYMPEEGGIKVTDIIEGKAEPRIYCFCKSSDVLNRNSVWYDSPMRALSKCKDIKDARPFSATIDSNAKVFNYRSAFSKALLQSAILKEADVVSFMGREFIILNPNVLLDIEDEIKNDDSEDVNDAFMQVGQRDNYDGLTPYFFPGTQGMMPQGYGSAAGPVTMPFGLQY